MDEGTLKPEPMLPVPEPSDRLTIEEILEEITSSETYKEQIVERRTFEAKEAQLGELNILR